MDISAKFIRQIPDSDVYRSRLSRELELIKDLGFSSVFVLASDIVRLTSDIPHIIRGSAGGSLVCYLLGISDIDPIVYGISLARFMHQKRKSIPDIDIDYPYNRRDEVFDRIYRHFGRDKVARISNHLHFRAKSALREAARRLKKDKDNCATVSLAKQLEGTFRGFSKHCGGLVFFENGVPEDLKLRDGQILLDKRQVQSLGMFKIDVLSNRALAQLADISSMSLSEYAEDDALAGELLSNGDSLGIIMGESPAVRKIFKSIQPKNMLETAFALALLRPAAAKCKQRLKSGQSPLLVFDDDATEFFMQKLGCSDAEADNFRRDFANGDMERIKLILDMFKSAEDRSLVEANFHRLRLYSFCKGHSISYGRLTWALAYWKAREPWKFWVSTLNHSRPMYRSWVHYRYAIEAGLDVMLGTGPWHLEGNKAVCLRPALSFDDVLDYKRFGYWTSNNFLECCFAKYYSEQVGVFIKFAGLVATYKTHRGENGWVTFVSVGVGRGQMLDLVLSGRVRLRGVDIVSGFGMVNHAGDIQVNRFELQTV